MEFHTGLSEEQQTLMTKVNVQPVWSEFMTNQKVEPKSQWHTGESQLVWKWNPIHMANRQAQGVEKITSWHPKCKKYKTFKNGTMHPRQVRGGVRPNGRSKIAAPSRVEPTILHAVIFRFPNASVHNLQCRILTRKIQVPRTVLLSKCIVGLRTHLKLHSGEKTTIG